MIGEEVCLVTCRQFEQILPGTMAVRSDAA